NQVALQGVQNAFQEKRNIAEQQRREGVIDSKQKIPMYREKPDGSIESIEIPMPLRSFYESQGYTFGKKTEGNLSPTNEFVGFTQNGKLPIYSDNRTGEVFVNDNNKRRLYNPQVDGIPEGKALPQSAIQAQTNRDEDRADIENMDVDPQAYQYLFTGEMPSLGMASADLRKKILKRSNEALGELGIDSKELPSVRSKYKSVQAAHKKVQERLSLLEGYEQGMVSNLDYAKQISKTVDRSKFPTVNKFLTWARINSGDPRIIKFLNSTVSATREYMRVATGAVGGVAELSVSAQERAEELLNVNLTWDQFDSSLEAMEVDINNVRSGVKSQVDKLERYMADPAQWYHSTKGGTQKDPSEMTTEELLKAL
ncbi:MAG TPA: hypothetical protein PLV56_09825, partial [Synergistales bacterium]|nr:hypothetical protein [Synergistales bacterium]